MQRQRYEEESSVPKKILAIIPARSGSKGLKDKNIKLLAEKPLIAYTIEAAIGSKIFEDIIVSTDSVKYAEVAKMYGAKVPFMRTPQLATDVASTSDVIIETLEQMQLLGKEYDYFMLLQPTSPLRKEEDIIGCIKLLEEKQANAVVSICECEHPATWTLYLGEEKCIDGFGKDAQKRRQEQRQSYRLNGAIYLAKVDYYLEHRDFYHSKSYGYCMGKSSSIDIDDIYDFLYAEAVIKYNQGEGR